MKLERLSTIDVAARVPRGAAGDTVLAIPVGSCEQHGPHLPLGTDTIIASTLADRLAARVDGVLVGPPLTLTSSDEHAGFPGTLSIGAAATELVVVELVRSADWVSGIVLVNGHGGNAEPVNRALATLGAEGRRIHAWWPRVPGGDAHAGHTETSLLLAIDPQLVDLDRAAPGDTRPLAEIEAELRTGGVRTVSPNGVLGDPRSATAQEGLRLLNALGDDLVADVTATFRA